MTFVGMSLEKVVFLRFIVLIAEESYSLVKLLKEKNFLFVRYVLLYSNYAWVITIVRKVTLTRIITNY